VSTAAPTEAPPAAAPPYPAALTITGPAWSSRLAHDGRVFLSAPEVHLGLLSTNEIVLTDPQASRMHAVIRWCPKGYVLQDSGSKTGTLVEGHRVYESTLLLPGQHVRIGSTELTLEAVSPPPAPGVMAAPASIPGPRQSSFGHWMALQRSKRYWRVFVLGLASYLIAALILNSTDNDKIVPLVAIIGAAVVPVTFVVFCWEEGAFADMPPLTLGMAFFSGGLIGTLSAAILYSVVNPTGSSLPIAAGFVEETTKVLAAVWFLRDRRLRSELDGLVIGAAVGMGFAAFETAGYGFESFLVGFVSFVQTHPLSDSFAHGFGAMETTLWQRMLLAVFGHGTWTAIVCAAIWRERGERTFRLTGGVVLAYLIAVGSHALYDGVAFNNGNILALVLVSIPALLVLRFFILEAVARARLGAFAPPPPPLASALAGYFAHLLHFGGRQAPAPPPQLVASLAAATPVTAPAAATPAPSATVCPRCGAPVQGDARFCGNCGSPIPRP